jgi:hypothetical protein
MANAAARMVIDPAFTVAEVDERVFGSFGPSALTRRSARGGMLAHEARPAQLRDHARHGRARDAGQSRELRPAGVAGGAQGSDHADEVLFSKLLE